MGLDTTAIETCIVGWADETQDGAEIPAARAELAALLADNAALRVALSGLLGGINVYDRPDPGQSVCRGLHTLRAVDEAIALVVADVGGGAAGARDETAVKAEAWDSLRRQAVSWVLVGGNDVCTHMDKLLMLLAGRAGGAGEGEHTDG